MSRDDRPVLIGCTGRTEASFTGFVAVNRASLVRRTLVITGGWEEAEDLVQAALWSTYQHWTRMDPTRSATAYVMRTVVNRFISEHTRSCWKREILCATTPEQHAPAEEHDVQRDDVVNALASLPKRQRAVLWLRFYCDLSAEETAIILGVTASTIRSQTTRALRTARLSSAQGPARKSPTRARRTSARLAPLGEWPQNAARVAETEMDGAMLHVASLTRDDVEASREMCQTRLVNA